MSKKELLYKQLGALRLEVDSSIIDEIVATANAAFQEQLLQQTQCKTLLPPAEVSKKADKIGKEFKRKWEAKYVGFGDGSTIELWWRHQIEDAFGGK